MELGELIISPARKFFSGVDPIRSFSRLNENHTILDPNSRESLNSLFRNGFFYKFREYINISRISKNFENFYSPVPQNLTELPLLAPFNTPHPLSGVDVGVPHPCQFLCFGRVRVIL